MQTCKAERLRSHRFLSVLCMFLPRIKDWEGWRLTPGGVSASRAAVFRLAGRQRGCAIEACEPVTATSQRALCTDDGGLH